MPAPAFAHPLIAAAVYDQIGPARRARLHARAAELAEDEATRLRHLAAAAAGPDAELAARLEALAERKGAAHSLQPAALAMVSASRLSVPARRARTRLLRAVDWMLVAGDVAHARAFAEEVAAFADSPRRSSILGQLAEFEGHIDEAAALFVEAWEHCDPDADPVLAAIIAHRNAYHALRSLRDEDVVVGAGARSAWRRATRSTIGWTATLALSLWRLGARRGGLPHARGGQDRRRERRPAPARPARLAAVLQRRHRRRPRRPRGGRRGRAADRARCCSSSVRLTVLSHLQYATGEWSDAVVSAERAMALASEAEHPHSAFVWWAAIAVPAARGDWAAADTYARMAAAEPIEATDRTVPLGMTRALLATARGDAEAVLAALEPVAALSPNPASTSRASGRGTTSTAMRSSRSGARRRPTRSCARTRRCAAERGRAAPVAQARPRARRVEATLGRREQARRRSSARSSTSSRSACPTSRR